MKSIALIVLCLVNLVLFASVASAQPARAWTRTVGQTMASNTFPRSMVVDSGGGAYCLRTKGFRIATVGMGYAEVVKLSPTGAVVWTYNAMGSGLGLCQPDSIVLDNVGNPIVKVTEIFPQFGPRTYLTKLSATVGVKIWETTNIGLTSARIIRTDNSGNIFVAGVGASASDLRVGLTKLSGVNGAVLWTKTITRAAPGISDTATDMAVGPSGNVAIGGVCRTSNRCASQPPQQILIEKVNGSTGATLWATTYTAAANDIYPSTGVRDDGNGNVCVAASANRSGGYVWVCSRRLAATGAADYTKVITTGSLLLSALKGIAVDSARGLTLIGEAFNFSSNGSQLYHFNTIGTQDWAKFMPNQHVSGFSQIGDNPSAIAAIGTTALTTALTQDVPVDSVGVTRISLTNGNNVWHKDYTPGSKALATCVAVPSNGDSVFAASLETGSNPSTYQAITGRYAAANGAIVYSNIPGNAIIGTPDCAGDLIVDGTGNLFSTAASASRYVTEKVGPTGALLWQNVFDSGPSNYSSEASTGAMCLIRDSLGNIIAGGTNHGSACVQKINGATGATMWSKRLNIGMGRNLAVDSLNNIYVPCAGPSQVLKLASGNGDILWTGAVNGAGFFDSMMYVAVDSAGNPFVSGITLDFQPCPGQNLQRILVARLNPSTGVTNWMRELVAPVAGTNAPCGLSIDSTGFVLVAGSSDGPTNSDYVAARLNPTSGAILWQTRHDNGGRNERATSMALDSSNNLYLTGTSSSAVLTDAWTIKVNGSTGARAWGNLLSTPVGFKSPTDLTRDTANNVYVGGLVINGATTQMFGQKISSAGATIWNAVSPAGALEAPWRPVSVVVSPTNRLHEFGSVSSAGTGLSQTSLFQFGP